MSILANVSKKRMAKGVDLARLQRTASKQPLKLEALTVNNRSDERKPAWCVCSVYAGGHLLKEGVIVDVSKTGARVKFRSRGYLPNSIVLKAGRIGLNVIAEVMWQDTYSAGLMFRNMAEIRDGRPSRFMGGDLRHIVSQ